MTPSAVTSPSAFPCRHPGGCGNTTREASGLCHLHRDARTVVVGGLPVAPPVPVLPTPFHLMRPGTDSLNHRLAFAAVITPTALHELEDAVRKTGIGVDGTPVDYDPDTASVSIRLRDREEVVLTLIAERWSITDGTGTEVESGERRGPNDRSRGALARAERRARGRSAFGRFVDRFTTAPV